MIYKNLGDIIKFTAGKNTSRLENLSEDVLYTQNDFEDDLQGINENLGSGCIVNLIRSKAAPLTQSTVSKCLTTNFLLCEFNTNELDTWYFCYLFNESKEVQQQLNKLFQGNTLSVRKLTIKNIGELKIKVLDIHKQRVIGQLYREAIRKTYLMQRQVDNISKLTKEAIRKIEED